MLRFPQYLVMAVTAACAGCASAPSFGPWSDPQPVTAVNSPGADGCPIEGLDGKSLYIASTRTAPGAVGKQDIYRSTRPAVGAAWGTPQNLGPPVNTPEFDYCPTPVVGNVLLFVTSMPTPQDCHPGDVPPAAPPGGPAPGDMYRTKEDPAKGWSPPVHLGCFPSGPNTAGAEFSPSVLETAEGRLMFFSSNGYPDSQGQDIYVSRMLADGTVLAGTRVAELSTAADDRMPNVRADGLEIVFSSNRAGKTPFDQDIYVATRASTSAPWSAPQRLENTTINTPAAETRASLSADGTRLYFGRKLDINDPGDTFVATRPVAR